MKKRLLFIGLALGLVLSTLMPATALAKPERPALNSFEGSGFVTGAPSWRHFSSRPTKGGYILCYEGEVVPGYMYSCPGWDALVGATLGSTHDSIVIVDKSGKIIWGEMWGEFVLTAADGSKLEGQFSGEITAGELDPTTGTIFWVEDEGRWMSTRGTGVFRGVEAWGTWAVQLPPITSSPYTLLWDGQYIKNSDHDGNH
jgi:hypothetical protein